MAKYAKLNTQKTDVIKLLIAEEEDINKGIFGNSELFIDVTNLDYVSVGSTYDEDTNTFKPFKPYLSWIFDEENNKWVAPIEKPEGFYFWKEESQSWEVLE